jgi:hypothetical protein
MKERVQIGKEEELKILHQMQDQGIPVTEATEREDKISKIDAWWLMKAGQPAVGLQIKYRETGDDILFEAMLDIDKRVEGRDMRGRADYYLSVDRKGSGAIVRMSDLKGRIQRCLAEFDLNGIQDKEFPEEGVSLKIRTDPYHGQRKCIAFVKKENIPVVKRLQFTGIGSGTVSASAPKVTIDKWLGSED